MPAFPELSRPLSGPAAALRQAAERDIPETLIAHQDDPDMHVRIGLERPPSGAELGRRIDGGAVERASGAGVWLTIVAAGEDECCGGLDVHEVDWDHLRAEIGIWVGPQRRGRGMATDALRLGARWLLDTCGLKRVQLLTEPDNAPMRRAARKAGFGEEGVLRAYLRERNDRVDVVVISLIAEDLEPTA
ncbi:MAG TPA: GNAT family protein [Solirubrobacteraceae bacterium]|jgi:RimJ/RimL family protein N-acetyltransferase|nr:GNAT family protein [Solirubrobacteraceae bacterium]